MTRDGPAGRSVVVDAISSGQAVLNRGFTGPVDDHRTNPAQDSRAGQGLVLVSTSASAEGGSRSSSVLSRGPARGVRIGERTD